MYFMSVIFMYHGNLIGIAKVGTFLDIVSFSDCSIKIIPLLFSVRVSN